MSHFSVMVRLPAGTKSRDIEAAVGVLMDPYCEHDDNGRLPLKDFRDCEDEYRKEYETESTEMVRIDGKLVLPWSEEFKEASRIFLRDHGMRPRQSLSARSRAQEEELKRLLAEKFPHAEIPHKDRFATLEEYAAGWHGNEARDPVKGRYGYWHNEQSKWDYWRIGGRWRGDLYVKRSGHLDLAPLVEAGLNPEVPWEFNFDKDRKEPVPGSATEVDWCRVRDLDMERIDKEARERADKFWADVDGFFSGKEFEDFGGPRSVMMSLGMLDCRWGDEIKNKPLTGTEFWTNTWGGDSPRLDVVEVKPSREKDDARVVAYLNPVRPWAYLDAGGWHEKGEMGWFGCGGGTPESADAHARDFGEWLKSGDQADWLVVCDCHV